MADTEAEPSSGAPPCSARLVFRSLYRLAGILLFVVPLYQYARFSPVYSATECGDQVATVDNTGLFIKVTCWNPNPYHIQILTSRRGRAFLGDGPGGASRLDHFGELEVMPGSQLNAQGSGSVRIRIDTELPTLLAFLADRETPLLMELDFDVGVQVSLGLFGLLRFETTAPFKKACGLNIRLGRPGPLICREAFVGMEIPPTLGAEARDDDRMRFTADQVDPDQIQEGENLKNLGMLLVGLPTCALGLAFALGLCEPALLRIAAANAAVSPTKAAALTGGGGTPTGAGCAAMPRMLYAKVSSPGSPRNLDRGLSVGSTPRISETLGELMRFVSCGRKVDGLDPLGSPAHAATKGGAGCSARLSSRSFLTPDAKRREDSVEETDDSFMGLPSSVRLSAATSSARV